ncbi:MAG: hypothetical protein AAF447_08460 [Myxococcota bacterium]
MISRHLLTGGLTSPRPSHSILAGGLAVPPATPPSSGAAAPAAAVGAMRMWTDGLLPAPAGAMAMWTDGLLPFGAVVPPAITPRPGIRMRLRVEREVRITLRREGC